MQVINASYQQNYKLSPLGFLRAGFIGKADREAWLFPWKGFSGISIFNLTSTIFTEQLFYIGHGTWVNIVDSGISINQLNLTGSGNWVFN